MSVALANLKAEGVVIGVKRGTYRFPDAASMEASDTEGTGANPLTAGSVDLGEYRSEVGEP